jgi:ATP-dependent DNA helicase RecG
MTQFSFPFDIPADLSDQTALWTPRDIWVHLNAARLPHFLEDRRLERKSARRVQLEDFAKYLSTFSNTPDGGLLVFGIEDKGKVTGCSGLSVKQLNEIEQCHLDHCPLARPEFKRIPVAVDGKTDFCLAIYVPYIGKLVETSKGEAWIRYGDQKRCMSEEEKRDFRSTRQELSFEQEPATVYSYPADFDLELVQDFCKKFRERDDRPGWSNEEVLLDRLLLQRIDGKLVPLNALVLLAANSPRRTIPGCRLRVQRFATPQEGSGETYSPLQDRFIEGNVVRIISESARLIADWIYDVTWLNKDGKFVTTPEYPRWAWFEAVVNACVHRSYNFSGTEITIKIFPDRMEIESPGGFVPPVNEETIYSTRAARNHNLMDALRYLGYVQMAREGTRRIRDSMQQYELPAPVFRQEALHGVVVKVTLRNRNDHESRKSTTDREVADYFGADVWKGLVDHEVALAAYIFHNKTIQVSEAQRITGRTWSTSKKDLERLTKKGLLMFQPGDYVRDPKATYRIAPRRS